MSQIAIPLLISSLVTFFMLSYFAEDRYHQLREYRHKKESEPHLQSARSSNNHSGYNTSDDTTVQSSNLKYLPGNSSQLYERFKSRFKLYPSEKNSLNVDMVYCISMESRHEYATEKLKFLNSTFMLFSAITPDDLTKSDYRV